MASTGWVMPEMRDTSSSSRGRATPRVWFHDIPAIGLPGAATWNEDRDAPLLDEIGTIYVVIEPDTGGAAVIKWLSRSSIRPRARLVRLRDTKDTSALYLAGPDAFKAAFQQALDDAQPCPEPETKKPKDEDTRAGRALVLHEPEPWPQPVDGAELLDRIAAGLRRYVVFDTVAADAVALWCVGTHTFAVFTIFPRLTITSPIGICTSCARQSDRVLIDIVGARLRLLWPSLRPVDVANVHPAGGRA